MADRAYVAENEVERKRLAGLRAHESSGSLPGPGSGIGWSA